MSKLRITLQGPPACETVPIVMEVLDDEMNLHWSGPVPIGESRLVPNALPAGRYAVLASLPSGKRAKEIVNLEGGGEGDGAVAEVVIQVGEPSASGRPEKLEWAQISKPSAFQRRALRPGQLRSIWLRLWARRPGGVWTATPWPTQQPTRDADLAIVQYDLPLFERSLQREYYLQIGGPTLRWRLIALPPDEVRVLVKGVELPNNVSPSLPVDPVEVSVTTASHHADVLLRYMRRGEMNEARQVSDAIIADHLAAGTTASPLASIIVGYFLLRTRDMKRLREWLRRPTPAVKGTADAALIDGWYQLRMKKPRTERARDALLASVARGLPVYTRGMRLLLDGLQMFDEPDETEDPQLQAEVHSALRRVRRYAAALDWQAPTTTFFAVDPDTPTPNAKEIRTGLPGDPAGVIFLTEATPDDLAWKGLLAGGSIAPAVANAPPPADAQPEDIHSVALGEAPQWRVKTSEYPVMMSAGLPGTSGDALASESSLYSPSSGLTAENVAFTGDAAGPQDAPVVSRTAERLNRIEHIVVLMMENRSFDHMLGYLSLKGGRADVDGLKDGMSNPYNGETCPIHHLTTLAFPADPCHGQACVFEQHDNGRMDGFVSSFAKLVPPPKDPGMIMGYYEAADVPMYDFLAREFVVCDRWFSSVLGPTLPNRAYSLAGESGGLTHNPRPFPPPFKAPTVFKHLSAANASWRYFAGDYLTANLRLHKGFAFNTHEIDQMTAFFKRAKQGNLPRVSWIDPDFGIRFKEEQNDDHPPADITRGQKLVQEVYDAIRGGGGDLWTKTLFIITYDEHGGFFDHVAPPGCEDDRADFRTYGIRVPAFVVSPWVERGAASHQVFDHTSIIKTILERFCRRADGTIPSLTRRVDAAVGLGMLLQETMRLDTPEAPKIPGPPLVHEGVPITALDANGEPLVPIPAPADDTDDFESRMLQLRAEMLRHGLPADKEPEDDDSDLLDHGPEAFATGGVPSDLDVPYGLADAPIAATGDPAVAEPMVESIESDVAPVDDERGLPAVDGVEIQVRGGEVAIRIGGRFLQGVIQAAAHAPAAPAAPLAPMMEAFAPAAPPPPPSLSFQTVPADKYADGYARFDIRSDLVGSYLAAHRKIKALGGVVTSSGAIRALTASVSAGRSATSLHYTGRAIDLYIESGMHGPNDPYLVVRDGGADDHPLWHVYAVSHTPNVTDPLYDASLIHDTELRGTIWTRHSGFTVLPRRARFFSVTDIFRQNGWLRIPSRSAWRTEYLSLEWWHFQNQQGLVVGQSRFGDELTKVWPAAKVAASGLRADAVWVGQSFRAA